MPLLQLHALVVGIQQPRTCAFAPSGPNNRARGEGGGLAWLSSLENGPICHVYEEPHRTQTHGAPALAVHTLQCAFSSFGSAATPTGPPTGPTGDTNTEGMQISAQNPSPAFATPHDTPTVPFRLYFNARGADGLGKRPRSCVGMFMECWHSIANDQRRRVRRNPRNGNAPKLPQRQQCRWHYLNRLVPHAPPQQRQLHVICAYATLGGVYQRPPATHTQLMIQWILPRVRAADCFRTALTASNAALLGPLSNKVSCARAMTGAPPQPPRRTCMKRLQIAGEWQGRGGF